MDNGATHFVVLLSTMEPPQWGFLPALSNDYSNHFSDACVGNLATPLALCSFIVNPTKTGSTKMNRDARGVAKTVNKCAR